MTKNCTTNDNTQTNNHTHFTHSLHLSLSLTHTHIHILAYEGLHARTHDENWAIPRAVHTGEARVPNDN